MPNPLSFRPVGGKAQYFGAKGTTFAEFLRHEYGDLPVTLSVKDIPKLETWRKGREGSMGILISVIRRYEEVEVGYFDV